MLFTDELTAHYTVAIFNATRGQPAKAESVERGWTKYAYNRFHYPL